MLPSKNYLIRQSFIKTKIFLHFFNHKPFRRKSFFFQYKIRWRYFLKFFNKIIYAYKYHENCWNFLALYNFFFRRIRRPFFKKFFNFSFFSFQFFLKCGAVMKSIDCLPILERLVFFKKNASLMKRKNSLYKNIMFSLFFEKNYRKKLTFKNKVRWPMEFSLFLSKYTHLPRGVKPSSSRPGDIKIKLHLLHKLVS